MQIDVVVDVKNVLGESPLWDPAAERIYWVDSLGQRIFRATAGGSEVRCWDVDEPIGSIALRRQGGALVAMRSGLFFLDFETGEMELAATAGFDPAEERFNDGKVDRQGRFVVGTVIDSLDRPAASLYRLNTDRTIEKLDTGFIGTNGPAWSPDGRTFYFQDTIGAREIWAYDYDAGSGVPTNRRTFVPASDLSEGVPDGSTVDSEGFLWNARCMAGKVIRYAPDGSVDRVIEFPLKKVTSVMFGGLKLDTLFVTTMGEFSPLGFGKEASLLRGSLLAVTGLGVTGLAETPFAG